MVRWKDPRIDFLKADVERFCAGLDDLAPAARLHLVVRLRKALDEATGTALDESMAAAKAQGWGLRRIGRLAGLSHEKVRCRLARPAAGAGGSA
ncbi:hypothetical protein ACFVZ3_06405 [Kitasatospora purpeofusca]|uniref:hypothetical protein n=1 Tax=Kitasatospora purpeofusca TaxID=67352 RepID=UPI003687355F